MPTAPYLELWSKITFLSWIDFLSLFYSRNRKRSSTLPVRNTMPPPFIALPAYCQRWVSPATSFLAPLLCDMGSAPLFEAYSDFLVLPSLLSLLMQKGSMSSGFHSGNVSKVLVWAVGPQSPPGLGVSNCLGCLLVFLCALLTQKLSSLNLSTLQTFQNRCPHFIQYVYIYIYKMCLYMYVYSQMHKIS